MGDNLLNAYRDNPQIRGGLITHQWRHSICGCFDNCGICIITYCFPCISFGQTAEARGKSCCCWCCLYLIPFVNLCCAVSQRGDLRTIRGIPGSCLGDCLCHIFCPFCVLAQERQESEHIQSDLLQLLGARDQGHPGVQVIVRQVEPGHPPPQGYPNQGYPPQGYPPHGMAYQPPQGGPYPPHMGMPNQGPVANAQMAGMSYGYEQQPTEAAPPYSPPEEPESAQEKPI